MAAKRAELRRLLEKMGLPIGSAFLEAVATITSNAQIRQLIIALQAGNVDAALQAAGVRTGSWAALTESIRNTYITGGAFVIARDVPKRFGAEFNINNPRAEQWLRQHSSQLITLINAEQRDAVQVVLRAGLQAGRNPRSVALDIVGRVGANGRRSGGVLGLNAPQTNAVVKARAELESLDSNYFTRTRRDKRFDGKVRKAIANETPLDTATVNRLSGRYSDRLLELRGSTIGRSESLSALNASGMEAMSQIVDEGLAKAEDITGIWITAGDERVRGPHSSMNGQERKHGVPFTAPDGSLLMHPGDSNLGAGPALTIQCRCVVTRRVDFIAIERAA